MLHMYRIDGKVALITGSTAGLGRELALQMCSLGARVVLNGRDQARLDRTALEFRRSGYEVAAVRGDVSSPGECREMIGQCIGKLGRLDIVVSNAGIGSGGLFADTTPEIFRKVFEINTLGGIYITSYALPHILETGGSIVFISSLAGLLGLPFSSLYSSSKMALTAIAESLQVELYGSNVHVGIVYAGFLKNAPEKRVLGPTGELQPTGERKNLSLQPMDKASRQIIRMIQGRRERLVLSTLGKALVVALRVAPWLVRMVLRHSEKRARKAYEPRLDP